MLLDEPRAPSGVSFLKRNASVRRHFPSALCVFLAGSFSAVFLPSFPSPGPLTECALAVTTHWDGSPLCTGVKRPVGDRPGVGSCTYPSKLPEVHIHVAGWAW